jgi:lipoprotein-releasing system ATP-binding protein
MTTPLLEAQNIKKTFFDPSLVEILKGVDLSLFAGQSAAIIGKSGEGKTTLLHVLGTLDSPSSGVLKIKGTPVTQENQDRLRNQHIGFIFQAFHLLHDCTVLENLLIPAQIARQATCKNSAAYEKAHMLLEQVGLEKRIHFSAEKLSGGEKQRVAIARAFMNDPDILLADEPTGNLDHQTALDIQNLLMNSVKKAGKALILVTHNAELARLLDTTYVLENGILKNAL